MRPVVPVIKAESKLISHLFYMGRFAVPWHQRYYDWASGDVEALLHDIDEALRDNRISYFLGSIMLLSTRQSKHWEINDGQQRMITLSLICASLSRRFRNEGKSQHEAQAIRMTFERDANEMASPRRC